MAKQPLPTASTQRRPPGEADELDQAPDAVQAAPLDSTVSGSGRPRGTTVETEDLPRLKSVQLTPLHESASPAGAGEPARDDPMPAEEPPRRAGAMRRLQEKARGLLAGIARGAARVRATARRLRPGLARREPRSDEGPGSGRTKLMLVLLSLNIVTLTFTIAVLLIMR